MYSTIIQKYCPLIQRLQQYKATYIQPPSRYEEIINVNIEAKEGDTGKL